MVHQVLHHVYRRRLLHVLHAKLLHRMIHLVLHPGEHGEIRPRRQVHIPLQVLRLDNRHARHMRWRGLDHLAELCRVLRLERAHEIWQQR
jgi:hypothetical protein